QAADRDLQQRQTALGRIALERLEAVELLVGEHLVTAGQSRPLRPRLAAAVLAGQQPARKREVRQHSDAEPLAHRQELLLRLAVQQRILIPRADRTSPAPLACEPRDLLDL